MPAIMRRTPVTEEASSYGYVDFLKDVVRKTVADTTAGFKRPTDFSDEEIMEMAFAGIGGGTKISKGLDPIKGILKKYKSQGLTYDAFVNQLPDMPKFAYHQWTFRGKGPLAKATVTTRGTSLDEFEEMVADRLRKFAKPMTTAANVRTLHPSLPDPITGKKMTKFRVRPGGRHSWKAENPVQTKLDREVVEGRIQPGKWKSEVREDEITGYIVEGYNPKTNKWLWFNTEDTWLAAERAVKRSEELLKRGKKE